jgi:hypothetical protein
MSKTPRQRTRQDTPVRLPVHGPIDHNAGIYLAIGSLVVNWANNESIFLAMLQTVMGGDAPAGNIVWYSQRTTKARLDLLLRLCQSKIADKALLRDIRKAASQFRGFTRARNFYCHGLYRYDERLRLIEVVSVSISDEGEPLRPTQKPFTRATFNELADTINKLTTLNRDLWALVPRLASALGVPSPQVPSLLPALDSA